MNNLWVLRKRGGSVASEYEDKYGRLFLVNGVHQVPAPLYTYLPAQTTPLPDSFTYHPRTPFLL